MKPIELKIGLCAGALLDQKAKAISRRMKARKKPICGVFDAMVVFIDGERLSQSCRLFDALVLLRAMNENHLIEFVNIKTRQERATTNKDFVHITLTPKEQQ